MNFINKNELFLLEEVVRRNFAAKYKDSILGIFWSVLKPLLLMIILTIVFSSFFTRNIDNYPVYILSGKCIYDFFTIAVNSSMNAIKGNKNILKKTAAPKHIFIIGSVISEFFNFIITLIILVAVMIVTKAEFYFTMPLSIIPIISLVLLITGLGLMLSILIVYYSDIQHLWGVITQIIFYASAIFYPMEIIPEPYHQYIILNPIFWCIDQFRSFFINGIIPNGVYVFNLLMLSLIILVIGIIIFKKYDKIVSIKF